MGVKAIWVSPLSLWTALIPVVPPDFMFYKLNSLDFFSLWLSVWPVYLLSLSHRSRLLRSARLLYISSQILLSFQSSLFPSSSCYLLTHISFSTSAIPSKLMGTLILKTNNVIDQSFTNVPAFRGITLMLDVYIVCFIPESHSLPIVVCLLLRSLAYKYV